MIDADGSVVHEIHLELPPEEVFEFFIDPARLTRWIGIAANLQPDPGGRLRFEIAPGQYCEGAYVEVRRPSFVSFTWGWTDPAWRLPPGSSLVSVALTPAAGGTDLVLRHTQLPAGLRAIHDEGWSTFLERLDATIAGRDPGPYPTEARP
jgi:uncharacterized protein YndB with AHSA1/START domain